jgi:putative SOS response-associated peptidase YedK
VGVILPEEGRRIYKAMRWGPGKLLSCTILTTDASGPIQGLHNRMPVMLSKEAFEPWLSGQDPVVDPGIGEAVYLKPVSPKMNSPRHNARDCIEALAGI